MYFDFEDYRPDTPHVEQAISTREGVLLSVILHAAVILFILFVPLPAGGNRAQLAQQLALRQPPPNSPRFVFVRPRVELQPKKPPPPQADASDRDRLALSRERPPDPKSALPFARGNSPERVEATPVPPAARADAPAESSGDRLGRSREGDRDVNGAGAALPLPNAIASAPALPPGRALSSGSLGEALRNLQRYVERESFDNPQGGGGDFGSSIQFDTKGVEFGPWIRRFVAQIKRNWFIPYAAMAMKGHVVITFNVHKGGTISNVQVQGASPVDSFNHAAYNALLASNPTQPLPLEYPSDRAFFTVTFYYNETPPSP